MKRQPVRWTVYTTQDGMEMVSYEEASEALRKAFIAAYMMGAYAILVRDMKSEEEVMRAEPWIQKIVNEEVTAEILEAAWNYYCDPEEVLKKAAKDEKVH